MSKRAVISFSGGLDSTTCLAIAKSEGYECLALSFNYGQRNSAEIAAAKRIAAHFKVKHEIFTLPIHTLGGSALTDLNLSLPTTAIKKDEIPVTYVPARNTIFLAVALGWAEIFSADTIFIGINATDYANYPDCRPDYLEAFQKMANLATKTAVEGHQLTIRAPLLHLSKAEIIAVGEKLGVDYSLTLSCYQASETGMACGQCHSCQLRKKGFAEAGIADPTPYI